MLAVAEYVIFDKLHWMDKLSVEDVLKRELEDKDFRKKYDARYQRGDIVDAGYDGRFGNMNNPAFTVIKKPGEPVDYKFIEELKESGRLIKNRKYKVDLDNIGTSSMEDLAEEKTVGISRNIY